PPVTVNGQVTVSTATSGTSNESSPSIVIDPNNPNHLAAVWTRFDTQPNPDLYTVEAAFSNDGGQTWTPFSAFGPGVLGDPNTTNPRVPYTRVTDASIGIDGNSMLYILVSEHNDGGDSGSLVLNSFNFSSGTPTRVVANNVVKQWIPGGDQVANP